MSTDTLTKPRRKNRKSCDIPPLNAEQQQRVTELLLNAEITARHAVLKYECVNLDYDDALSHAYMGLCWAARTWQPGHGASWKTYAIKAMRHAIIQHLPGDVVVKRSQQHYAHKHGQKTPGTEGVRDYELAKQDTGSRERIAQLCGDLLVVAKDILTDLEFRCLGMRLTKPWTCVQIGRRVSANRTAVCASLDRAVCKLRDKLDPVVIQDFQEALNER